ncbi:ribonuclease III [Methanobrevibacter sp. DSM 116169]|uniref:ribonuclease III n=1 Tax=Methanobrevibacter sp. DSM 116169 TaxID=3242727 RepID=UPI0038FCC849
MKILQELNIVPNNRRLYDIALIHGSCSIKFGTDEDYERLEYLGDSVLNLIVSEYLYNEYPDKGEGFLTKLRANYVCQNALIYYCKDMGLHDYLTICINENQISENEVLSIYADIVEAFLGAIFLDQGLLKAKELATKYIFKHIDDKKIFFMDYKSEIKEYADANNHVIKYELIDEQGFPHNKTFTIKILIDGIEYGVGIGKNKKESEQVAAQQAIDKLGIEIN